MARGTPAWLDVATPVAARACCAIRLWAGGHGHRGAGQHKVVPAIALHRPVHGALLWQLRLACAVSSEHVKELGDLSAAAAATCFLKRKGQAATAWTLLSNLRWP